MSVVAARDRRAWAAVPFKGPTGSKRRLAPLLSPGERAALSRAMLVDVLDALLSVAAIERVVLLTPVGGGIESGGAATIDPRAVGLADAAGSARVRILADDPPTSNGTEVDRLNDTLRQAQRAAVDGGATQLLIVPADLPLVQAADVEALLVASPAAGIVVAPDRAADGTNALLLSPPDAMTPAFGVASFERHLARARAAGLRRAIVERAGLALDLDTPADVAALLAQTERGRSARLLRELGVPARLDRLPAGQARSATI